MNQVKRFGWLAALLNALGAGLGFLYLGRRGFAAANLLVAPVLSLALVFAISYFFLGSPLRLAMGLFLAALLFVSFPLAAWRLAAPIDDPVRPRWYEYAALIIAIAVVGAVAESVVYQLLKAQPTYRTYHAPSWSMWPSIAPGDYFVSRRIRAGQPLHRGDAVMYMKPGNAAEVFLSRVVAVAGDTVELNDNGLWVNGAAVPAQKRCAAITREDEDMGHLMIEGAPNGPRHFILQSDARASGRPQDTIIVPDGHVFLLGDNRSNASDSRFFGPLPIEKVVGTPLYVLWSADRRRLGMSLTTSVGDAEVNRVCNE